MSGEFILLADVLFGTFSNMFWNENPFVCVDVMNRATVLMLKSMRTHTCLRVDTKKCNAIQSKEGTFVESQDTCDGKKHQSFTGTEAFLKLF